MGKQSDINPASVIIDAFGGTKATADMLGVLQSSVSTWRKRRTIPAKYRLELLMRGMNKGLVISDELLMTSRKRVG